MMTEQDSFTLHSIIQKPKLDTISLINRANFQSPEEPITSSEEGILQEAENLPLLEKLKHPKWQIRRKTYYDLYEFFAQKREFSEMNEENFTIESFLPWLKNIVNDQNLISLTEGLRALNTFIGNYAFNKSYLSYFAGEIIERLAVAKTTIQSLVGEIIAKMITADENNILPNEILKRIEHCKNPKYLNALLGTLNAFIMQNSNVDAPIIRLCFKSILQLLEHTNKGIRVTSLEIIKTLYSRVEEKYEDLEKSVFTGLRSVHLKDLEGLKKCPKLRDQKLIKLIDGTVRYTENNLKKPSKKLINEQKVDLASILPDKYLDVPYLLNQGDKQRKLEELNRNIEGIYSQGGEIDGSKDCSFILQIITLMLEDQNILINGEAIKTIRHLIRIFSRGIPLNKLKHILLLIVEKFKGKKKTQYNSSLIFVLDDCLKHDCMNIETLVEFVMSQAESNRNHSVRIACLNWFTRNFLDYIQAIERRESIVLLEEGLENCNEKELNKRLKGLNSLEEKLPKILMFIYKSIQNIQKKDSLIKVREACQEFIDRKQLLSSVGPRQKGDKLAQNLHELSSIKNSKVINASNISIAQFDGFSAEKRGHATQNDHNENEILKQIFNDKSVSSFLPEDSNQPNHAHFAFDKLSANQKESFNRLMGLFSEVKISSENLGEKLDQVYGALEKMDMDLVQTCQEPILKSIWKLLVAASSEVKKVNQFFEQINSILIKLNRICLELTDKVLDKELKILLLFIANILHAKHVEKVLDSAYMTCSIERFLTIGLEVLSKLDEKYSGYFNDERLQNSIKYFIGWVCQKLDKTQTCMVEETKFKKLAQSYSIFKFQNMPQLHYPLVAALEKKIKRFSVEEQNEGLGKNYETPSRSRRSKMSSPEVNVRRSTTCENVIEAEKEYFGKRVASVDAEIRSNISSGLGRLNDLLESMKKRRIEVGSSQMMSSPQGNFVSPNRHWKRGVGRDTPLKNLGKGQEGGKVNYQLTAEEVQGIFDAISQNLGERELGEFESTMRQLRSACTTKECLLIIRSTLTAVFWNSSLMRICSARERIFSSLLMFCDGIEKFLVLQTIKTTFSTNYKAFAEYRVQMNYFTFLTVEFISNWLLLAVTNGWAKLLNPIAEVLVFALSTQETYMLADRLLTRAVQEVQPQDLKRMYELELIHSARLYQVFSDWFDSKFGFDKEEEQKSEAIPPLSRILSPKELSDSHLNSASGAFLRSENAVTFKQPTVIERRSEVRESFPMTSSQLHKTSTPENLRRSLDEFLRDSNKESQMIYQSQNNEFQSEVKPQVAADKAKFVTLGGQQSAGFFESSRVDTERSIGLKSPYDLVDVPYESGEMEFAQAKPSLEGELPNTLKTMAVKPENQPKLPIYQNNPLQTHQHNPLLASENFSSNRSNQFQQSHYQAQSQQMRSQDDVDSAEKWKNKYLREKQNLQKTIDILDKTQMDYQQKCSHTNGILSKLEEQRRVNEHLLEKFNEVSNENGDLKRKAEELQKSQALEIMMMTNSSNAEVKQPKKYHPFIQKNLAIAGDKTSKESFIKKMQEILLTSESLKEDINESLLLVYENLITLEEKLQYVADLKGCLMNPTIIEHLTEINHRFLLELSIKLCVSENTQREIVLSSDGVTFIENELTQELQVALDILLRYHNMSTVLINLVKILSDRMPQDFDTEMAKGQKMMLKLTVKCIVRLTSSFKPPMSQEIRVFDVLLELYKLFKVHPPEKLREDQPSIKEYDLIYRNLKVLNDSIIDLNPIQSKKLVDCLKNDISKNIFLGYIQSYIEKYHPSY